MEMHLVHVYRDGRELVRYHNNGGVTKGYVVKLDELPDGVVEVRFKIGSPKPGAKYDH